MKNVTSMLKQFCGKLLSFSEKANELMEMTEELKSFSTENGMRNFSMRSKVKIRNFSSKIVPMTEALEDLAVSSDDMLMACPKEKERMQRKFKMVCRCFSDLQEEFKSIESDVKDAVELAAQEGELSKAGPATPKEPDLQKEDTSMDVHQSATNGTADGVVDGDASISKSESVNADFSKSEYLKSLFNRIVEKYNNFSDKLNEAGDAVEEVTDEVVADQSTEEETCPECGKKVSECECTVDDDDENVEIKGSVLDKENIEDQNPDEKTELNKTEDETEVEGDFCSVNFAESVAQDKEVAPEVHESLKVLTKAAEDIKSGSLKEVDSTIEALEKLESKNKNFAAITACALMCFSEICKECGQVIPGTEDKVETTAEDETKTDETTTTDEGKTEETSTEETKTEETKSDDDSQVAEAQKEADVTETKEDDVEPPTEKEIIMNFSEELEKFCDEQFKQAPAKTEGEDQAKPEAQDAPNKSEGHPEAVVAACFSVLDACDSYLNGNFSANDVVSSITKAQEIMAKSYPTPEQGQEFATKFANFCGDLGMAKAIDNEDVPNSGQATTTVDPVIEGNDKLNKLVEALKSKLDDVTLDPIQKSFATKVCDGLISRKCFSKEDLDAKMTEISNFSDELEGLPKKTDTTDAEVTAEVKDAVEKAQAAQEQKTEELKSDMKSPSDSEVVMSNFSKKETSDSDTYGARMLRILGIRG